MSVGLRGLNVAWRGSSFLREMAHAAEEAEVESLWVSDHVVLPSAPQLHEQARTQGEFVDAFASLGYLAAVTKRVRLGAAVVVLPLRHPLLVAKAAAGVAALSGGRLLLGVGCGWLETEFRALGIGYADRGPRTDEYLAALRAAWGNSEDGFAGRYAAWRGTAAVAPRPPSGEVPIVVGGETGAALERALRHGDGFFPTGPGRLALAEAFRRQRPGTPITLPVLPDGADLRDAVRTADRVVLTVRPGAPRADFGVADPAEVAPAVARVHDMAAGPQ
ncbi:TIGR03619 family F420-dependent LLM class oxidoreductase [Streptomyces sp. CB02009]|uniref:TIGR03619 family F420-dependent LLM class oxidoreductase n=1 Tax=Streptomyces sp. CB02009 TaxID=1703938 RepID=UPI001300EF40|nr:TIGR03619 family F420-dependent LLM class oxidoreductase [Streptomyces sp. CB02009]